MVRLSAITYNIFTDIYYNSAIKRCMLEDIRLPIVKTLLRIHTQSTLNASSIIDYSPGRLAQKWLRASLVIIGLWPLLIGGASLSSIGVYTDPFIPYDAILPANPASALKKFNCPIAHEYINGQIQTSRYSCTIIVQDEVFDIIHVDIQYEKIAAVTFYMNHVSLGQPLLHWEPLEHPTVTDIGVSWNTATESFTAYGARLNYHSPIRILIVSENFNDWRAGHFSKRKRAAKPHFSRLSTY